MTGPDQHWLAANPAQVAWDSNDMPRSLQFDDTYYGSEAGLEESRYVFLHGNGLPNAWRNRQHFTIAETGFGTGLNFLNTWAAWRSDSGAPGVLHFVSVERYPLSADDLQRSLANWPSVSRLASQLLQSYPPPLPGRHRLLFEGGRVILDLLLGDAQESLQLLCSEPDWSVNAWYLDGFTPSRNPDMWTKAIFTAISQLSAPAATLATFSASSDVRRGLQACGFNMNKPQGFGGKRHMLCGTLAVVQEPAALQQTPWHISRSPEAGAQAIVLGAGLAGTSVAAALARRGWRVTILDQGSLAGGASGNEQGILYTRLSHQTSALNSFSLHSYTYALRHYQHLYQQGLLESGVEVDFCGGLHLGTPPPADSPLAETQASMQATARYVSGTEAEQLSGLADCPGGLFFPGAGWLAPAAVCRAHCQHPNISLRENCGALGLKFDDDSWRAVNDEGITLATAGIAIVALGTHSRAIPGLDWLPLQSIRGQVTHLPSHGALAGLRTVICHQGYIPPALAEAHCIGATFDIEDPDPALRRKDHQFNLDRLHEALPGIDQTQDAKQLSGRVGFRCASPDYLPMAGPVPDRKVFAQDYRALRRNARSIVSATGSFLPGLYLSTAHGSRGLTSTPLTAELLASQICCQPWPVDSELCRALAPARFIIRDLVRNRL